MPLEFADVGTLSGAQSQTRIGGLNDLSGRRAQEGVERNVGRAAVWENDSAAMQRGLDWAKSKPYEFFMLQAQAGTAPKTAYRQFLGLWKDADADLPPLKQARLELARVP